MGVGFMSLGFMSYGFRVYGLRVQGIMGLGVTVHPCAAGAPFASVGSSDSSRGVGFIAHMSLWQVWVLHLRLKVSGLRCTK